MKNPSINLAITVLRWGIAFVFFFAGVAGMLNPAEWAAYVPRFFLAVFSEKIFFTLFGLIQIVLAVWLLTGKKLKLASALSSATLAAIVIATLDSLNVTFCVVGLALAAFALYSLAPEKTPEDQIVKL